jgi:hypothetical protein
VQIDEIILPVLSKVKFVKLAKQLIEIKRKLSEIII